MKDVTIKVYEFNELPAALQEKLIQQEVESEVDIAFSVFGECAKDVLLSEYGIRGEVYYSLAYQQGDGLHFETDDFLTEKIIEKARALLSQHPQALIFDSFNSIVSSRPIPLSVGAHSSIYNRYEYASLSDVQIVDEDEVLAYLTESCCSDEQTASFVLKTILSTLQNIYIEICSDLEKMGYACYDVDKDSIVKQLNDCYYYGDGRFYGMKEEVD